MDVWDGILAGRTNLPRTLWIQALLARFWDQGTYKPPECKALPAPKSLPNVSAATYFGARQPPYARHMANPPARVDGNYGMGQIPEAHLDGQGVSAGVYPGMR